MLRRLLIAAAVALAPSFASAEPMALIAPTAPSNDNSDKIANTAWVKANGGGGSPGGSTGQLQFNNVGGFGGISGATSDGTTITLVAPILGTPASGNLANTTGFPVANLSGAVSACLTWLATSSSANLRSCLSDETGTGLAYFQGGDIGTPSAGVATNFSGTAASLTAGNATKLATARAIGIGGSTGLTATGVNFDGTAAINPVLAGTLALTNGGTGATTQPNAAIAVLPTPTRAGDVLFWNGTAWTTLAGNNSGTQVLQENASGIPSWATVSGTGTVTSAQISAGTGIAVATTSGANPCVTSCNLTVSLSASRQTLPTADKLTTAGASQTYNVPAGTLWQRIRVVGTGGGGAGSGTAGNGSGSTSSANTITCGALTLTASPGVGAAAGGNGGAGGNTGSVGNVDISAGQDGQGASSVGAVNVFSGAQGGNSAYFGGGGTGTTAAGGAGKSGTGGGGAGGGTNSATFANAPGGGAGQSVEHINTTVTSTCTYSLFAGPAGGAAGTSGFVGGAGGSGKIIIENFYN